LPPAAHWTREEHKKVHFKLDYGQLWTCGYLRFFGLIIF